MPPPFRDRRDAGRQLAEALSAEQDDDLLVLGLARGGIPVAAEVAGSLDAPLDVLCVRKLSSPVHPEFGFGALARDARFLDERSMRALGITGTELAAIEADARNELMRREAVYRAGRLPPRIQGRVVLVVDDGVATGGTARAALRSVRQGGPRRLVFAAPVAAAESLTALREEADEVVVLRTPTPFRAVGLWYEKFDQTSDEEVVRTLARHVPRGPPSRAREVRIDAGGVTLDGTLTLPPHAVGLVVFAHGSGSSRFSPRNRAVARALQERGLATLLLDLLTPEEEAVDLTTREHRFDIDLLAARLVATADDVASRPELEGLAIGLFGSSTGGGAALVAAARRPGAFRAVVSRGGRPDLAADALPKVDAPTLLLVGDRDRVVVALNEEAARAMRCPVELSLVPGATHLFEEPGTLDEVAGRAGDFFVKTLRAARGTAAPRGRA